MSNELGWMDRDELRSYAEGLEEDLKGIYILATKGLNGVLPNENVLNKIISICDE